MFCSKDPHFDLFLLLFTGYGGGGGYSGGGGYGDRGGGKEELTKVQGASLSDLALTCCFVSTHNNTGGYGGGGGGTLI